MEIKSKEIRLVDIHSLKPNPKNRNKHSKEQIQRLIKLIEYQGFRNPIVVSNRTGMIVAGHGRLDAAKKMKLKQVPVIHQDFDDENQEHAYLISDNAIQDWSELDLAGINEDVINMGPEFDIDLLGIKDFVLEPAEKFMALADDDAIPDKVEPKTKLGDIYKLGRHRLMCGDSTSIDAVEKLIDGNIIELCFTSPPYADQREYNGGKELSSEHLATFIRSSYSRIKYFAVNLGYSRKNGEVNSYWEDYIKEAKSCGLKFLSWNIWDKGQAGSIGNQTAMFAISHEWIFVFGSETKDLNLTRENIRSGESMDRAMRRKDGSMYYSGDKFEVGDVGRLNTVLNMFPQKDRSHGINHPAMFPVGLPSSYIEAMTKSGDFIYEPFGGSGTTMVASEKTNRNCLMMELDPHYCDVIVARWEQYTGQKAELING